MQDRVLTCSQCGRPLPDDPDQVRRWKHGELALAGELDELTATMLLCPGCDQEDRTHAFDEGGGD